ncbi:MAG: PucR family transcriptional regulator [Frankiales bacterium]|nr:PucR family transcriptional regulator [Frankiales bacterium]
MTAFALEPGVMATLRAQLPAVAEQTVQAVTAEVPEYADAFSGEMGATIQGAVQMALGGFLRLASELGQSAPLGPVREGAYALGRGEARSGRTADALLAAYRVGARVAWRELSATAVERGLPSEQVAQFAELVFAYIDELSAASVAGHTDELATSGRVRQQYRERLAQALLAGATPDALSALADKADWEPPGALTAALVSSARTRDALALLSPDTLSVPGDLVGLADHDVLLSPDPRRALLRHLRGRSAVVGPTRPWVVAASSFARAVRLVELAGAADAVDTEEHLTTLVLTADAEALADLRAQVLAPLKDLPAGTADRLAETLRSWLLHQGRREQVAADLHVHAQTVRYRMTQIRELYGDQLTQPDGLLRLTVALAEPV